MFKMDFVKESWQRKYQAVQNDEVPWTPLAKPIEESRIVLVTTGGVHLKSDTPFDMSDSNGDPSFRMIPSQAKPEELMITHDYYDHRDADQDLNLVFPWQILHGLVEEGILGSLSDQFISFMGHIDGPLIDTLVRETAISASERIQLMQADIACLFLREVSATRRSVWSSEKSKAEGFPPLVFVSVGKSALRSNLREPIICDIPMVMRWANRSAKPSRSESCWKGLNFLNRLRNQDPLSTVLFVGKGTGSRK